MINNSMYEDFFEDVDHKSIVENIRGIYTSDSTLEVLLDFERVLDDADLYAYKNWIKGEVIKGPVVKRYTVGCTLMYPRKLMPDPEGAKRLISLGCTVLFKKTKIAVPVEIHNPDDFFAGTKYPKKQVKNVWMIHIQIPRDIIDDVHEGSVDLAGRTVDLSDIDEAYADDLDDNTVEHEDSESNQGQQV